MLCWYYTGRCRATRWWESSGDTFGLVERHSASAKGCPVYSKVPTFANDGFVMLPKLFSQVEVAFLRNLITDHYGKLPWHRIVTDPRANERFRRYGSTFTDLVGSHGTYSSLQPVTDLPLSKAALHRALRTAFNGSAYVFADMSEVQINRSVGWHRDVLHGIDRKAYRHPDLWSVEAGSGARYGMARLITYLQSHSHPKSWGSLHVRPGSQRTRGWRHRCGHSECNISAGQLFEADSLKRAPFPPHMLRPDAGDAILFDMRIQHCGHFDARFMSSPGRHGNDRISIQLSFGMRNVFTEEWRNGDRARRQRALSEFGVTKPAAACPLNCESRLARAVHDGT